jgi:hypothetical protein
MKNKKKSSDHQHSHCQNKNNLNSQINNNQIHSSFDNNNNTPSNVIKLLNIRTLEEPLKNTTSTKEKTFATI